MENGKLRYGNTNAQPEPTSKVKGAKCNSPYWRTERKHAKQPPVAPAKGE